VSIAGAAARRKHKSNKRCRTLVSPSVPIERCDRSNAHVDVECEDAAWTRQSQRLNVLSASGRRGGETNANQNEWWPNLLPRRRCAIQGIAQASQTKGFPDGLSLVRQGGMSTKKAGKTQVVAMVQ
jgi:hypothetical protein